LPIEDRSCRFHIAAGNLPRIGALLADSFVDGASFGRVLVVADETVARLYGEKVVASLTAGGVECFLHVVPAGESSKSLAQLRLVYEALAQHEVGRDGVVLAVGGGVVSDLAGLAAATWKRGVRFVICPTTLEAAVDAAIGGKTAINLAAGKNLVGAFHQPELVVIDPDCLTTLKPRDVRAGLAESVKHALITSESFLQQHEAQAEAILRLDRDAIAALIHENIRIKLGVVSEDPRERTGKRMVLNFGHTIGHAIESCQGFALRHGECVALGIVAALQVGEFLGLANAELSGRVKGIFERFELPTQLSDAVAVEDLLRTIRQDKKNVRGRVRMVLLEGVGRPVIRDDVPESVIRDAIVGLMPS